MFRLDRLERFALSNMFFKIPDHFESWLFGSRTDLEAKGGDIDVLIQADITLSEQIELSQKLTIEFQKHCEEKIDIVVYPKQNLNTEQKAFLGEIQKVPLKRVVQSPILDHAAFLVSDLAAAQKSMCNFGFPFQGEQEFPSKGTRAVYVGEKSRPARILLLQVIEDGPYQRMFYNSGVGLHHIGVSVFSLKEFQKDLLGTGWEVHPMSHSTETSAGVLYFFKKSFPLILEVEERQLLKPASLAPVVQKLRVKTFDDLVNTTSCLNIPELEGSTSEDSAIKVSGKWRSIQSLVK